MSVRKKGLGRGLDALIQDEPETVKSLPVDRLQPNRLQPRTRFDDSGLDELAESIRVQGVVQPLVVTPGEGETYVIVAGERRWRAARRAGLETVPVVVREVAGDRELLELALVENLQRSDLNAVEEAEAYQTLQGFGLTQEEVGSRVGKSRTAVTNALRLLKLPDEVRDMLRDGRLTAGQARPLLALDGAERQIEVAERAVAQGLSARDLERLAAQAAAAERPRERLREQTPPAPVEVHAAAAAEKLTRRLQTRVEIQRRGKGGLLQVHFHSEEELMRLYELLMQRAEEA